VCEVQLSYAIGVAKPTSVLVDTQGTGRVPDAWLAEQVQKHFELTPRGIIASLGLRRPIYRATATHGHFGRKPGEGGPGTFSWEATDKAAALRKAAEKAGLLKAPARTEPKPAAKAAKPAKGGRSRRLVAA
jgi:S-adenosylmethionine synthetase